MTVNSLDHVNIRVPDPEATAAFLIDILGMKRSAERATWIVDAAGHPAIHIGSADSTYPSDEWRPFKSREDSGAVHHVALACTGIDAVLTRLDATGIDYRINDIPMASLRQVFVVEPGGVMLELNFREG